MTHNKQKVTYVNILSSAHHSLIKALEYMWKNKKNKKLGYVNILSSAHHSLIKALEYMWKNKKIKN